jgi:hypothetical protein
MKLRETRRASDRERIAQRVAVLEEKLLGVLERNAQLEEQNAALRSATCWCSSAWPT